MYSMFQYVHIHIELIFIFNIFPEKLYDRKKVYIYVTTEIFILVKKKKRNDITLFDTLFVQATPVQFAFYLPYENSNARPRLLRT